MNIESREKQVAYEEYVIDPIRLTYHAVWNCQVEWTSECIFYDAETGIVRIAEDELVFDMQHAHKVTKHEYQQHVQELKALDTVTVEELAQMVVSKSSGNKELQTAENE